MSDSQMEFPLYLTTETLDEISRLAMKYDLLQDEVTVAALIALELFVPLYRAKVRKTTDSTITQMLIELAQAFRRSPEPQREAWEWFQGILSDVGHPGRVG